jgi:hypothetical protein
MKTKRKSAIIITAMTFAIFFIATLSVTYAAEQAKPAAAVKTHQAMKSAMVKVSGMIVANKNTKGKIVGYALQEDGGQALMLSKHGKGMELRKMVGSKVEATGMVKESKSGKMIIVKDFKKIE